MDVQQVLFDMKNLISRIEMQLTEPENDPEADQAEQSQAPTLRARVAKAKESAPDASAEEIAEMIDATRKQVVRTLPQGLRPRSPISMVERAIAALPEDGSALHYTEIAAAINWLSAEGVGTSLAEEVANEGKVIRRGRGMYGRRLAGEEGPGWERQVGGAQTRRHAHVRQDKTQQSKILEAMDDNIVSCRELEEKTGIAGNTITAMLSKEAMKGTIMRVGRGLYTRVKEN